MAATRVPKAMAQTTLRFIFISEAEKPTVSVTVPEDMLFQEAFVLASKKNPVVDVRTFYLVVFAMVFFLAPGRFLGIDRWLEGTKFVQRHQRLTWLLG